MKKSIFITGFLVVFLAGGWFYRDTLPFSFFQNTEQNETGTDGQANNLEGLTVSGGDGSLSSTPPTLSVTHTDVPSSFLASGTSSVVGGIEPFTVDDAGNVGIGTKTPARALDIFEPDNIAQLRLSKTADQYSEFTVNSVGDLEIEATGGDVLMLSDNLRVCDNGACPKLNLTGKGNIFVENGIEFGNGVYMKNTSDTELKVYDDEDRVMFIFDKKR